MRRRSRQSQTARSGLLSWQRIVAQHPGNGSTLLKLTSSAVKSPYFLARFSATIIGCSRLSLVLAISFSKRRWRPGLPERAVAELAEHASRSCQVASVQSSRAQAHSHREPCAPGSVLLQPQEARHVPFHGRIRSLCGNTRRGKPYNADSKISSSLDRVDAGSAGLRSLTVPFPGSLNSGRIGFEDVDGGVGPGPGQ